MADDITTPYGRVRTDEIGIAHVQRVKITAGPDGTATDLLGDAANGLDVDVTRITRQALTASAPTKATVGTSSSTVVTAKTRKGCCLINTSTNWIFLGIGVAAVIDSGIALAPNGGSWSMGEFDYTNAAINAIASGAGSNLAIQEFT